MLKALAICLNVSEILSLEKAEIVCISPLNGVLDPDFRQGKTEFSLN